MAFGQFEAQKCFDFTLLNGVSNAALINCFAGSIACGGKLGRIGIAANSFSHRKVRLVVSKKGPNHRNRRWIQKVMLLL